MGESHCWLTHELYKPLLIHGCKVRVASRHVTATSHISVPSSSKQPTSYRCLLLQVFFSFLFFFYSLSSEPVSCNIVIAVASTSPCSHTGNTPSLPHHPWGHSNHLLHPSSHRSQAHKSHPATLTLTMPGAPTKKTSDKSFPFFPSSLMVQDTSPSYACRPPLHYHHNHHHFIASTTGATSLTPLLLQLV